MKDSDLKLPSSFTEGDIVKDKAGDIGIFIDYDGYFPDEMRFLWITGQFSGEILHIITDDIKEYFGNYKLAKLVI